MLELLRILAKWRRPLLVMAGLAAIGSAIFVSLATPRYYAQASVLPPTDDPGFSSGISALLQQYQIPIPGGVKSPFLPTLYASIVSSRKMGKQVLDEFNLRPGFGTDNDDDALGVLRGRTSLKYTDDGLFLVGYEDKEAKRAADIVNAYVRHLDEMIQQVNSGRAGQTRGFIEKQIARCNTDLAAAEEGLRDFQRQHRAIQIDTQAEGALGLAAELQGRILAARVELDLLQQRATPASQEVREKSREIAAMETQYDNLTARKASLSGKIDPTSGEGIFPRLENVPDLALQYMRRMRELKVQETLYALLVQQLEQAKIEEQKNTPVLSVLDWAEPASHPVYPRKLLVVIAATLGALLWVAIVAVVVEKLRGRATPAAEAAGIAALDAEWQTMPGWVRRIERLVGR